MKKLLVVLFFLSSAVFADDKSPPLAPPNQVQSQQSDLQNDKHYVNSQGQTVHSPSRTKLGQAPAGASAQCADGTFSFSTHRQGTCSHHGGVSNWLQ